MTLPANGWASAFRSFWAGSIKRKLMLLFTANTIVALGLTSTIFWTYLTLSCREILMHQASTMAQMLAESTASALASSDLQAATQSLAILHAEPSMEVACLYNNDGKLFTAYLRSYLSSEGASTCRSLQSEMTVGFDMRSLTILHPVTVGNKVVGHLLLRYRLEQMYSRLQRFSAIGGVFLLAASFSALLLSLRMQRIISDPILHLTQVASRVSKGGNYAIRAAVGSVDETGVLIDQFNSMMEQVSSRDLKLKRAQDELEGRVSERTMELQKEIAEREVTQHDLLTAKLLAEESNRAKSAFMANMSHELRTPLNAILGYSEMLEEDAELVGDQPAVADLRRIQSAGRHLLELINDVLDLSKVEAGRVDLVSEPAHIGSLVNDFAATIEPLARKNRNVFLTTAQDPDETVYVDVTKFRQCVLNLLSNACKFTEGGIVRLRVERRVRNAKYWICWEVSDTGIGIAEHNRNKLFQAFSQVDSSATRRHGGTGLGLAISQRLTEMMGGWIEVDTVLGRGSTFTIYMPASELRATSPGIPHKRIA